MLWDVEVYVYISQGTYKEKLNQFSCTAFTFWHNIELSGKTLDCIKAQETSVHFQDCKTHPSKPRTHTIGWAIYIYYFFNLADASIQSDYFI